MKTITRSYTIISSPYFIFDEAPEYRRRAEQEIKSETFNQELLERYFNDIYTLFLHRLMKLECQPEPMMEMEKEKLRLMLDELIKVKGMMSESSQNSEKF